MNNNDVVKEIVVKVLDVPIEQQMRMLGYLEGYQDAIEKHKAENSGTNRNIKAANG